MFSSCYGTRFWVFCPFPLCIICLLYPQAINSSTAYILASANSVRTKADFLFPANSPENQDHQKQQLWCLVQNIRILNQRACTFLQWFPFYSFLCCLASSWDLYQGQFGFFSCPWITITTSRQPFLSSVILVLLEATILWPTAK